MTETQGNTDINNLLCCGLSEQATDLSQMFGAAHQKFMSPINGGGDGSTNENLDWPIDFRSRRSVIPPSPPPPWQEYTPSPQEERSITTYSPRRSSGNRDNGGDNHYGASSVRCEEAGAGRYGDRRRIGARRIHPIPHGRSHGSISKHNALALQEELIRNMDTTEHDDYSATSSQKLMMKPLTTRQAENLKLTDKYMLLNQQLDARAQTAKDAADRSKFLRTQALLAKKTETTRPKRDVTPSDVRDPETVAGMKSQVDVTLEEAATKLASAMLNDDQYRFSYKAGYAALSVRDIALESRKACNTLRPIV